MVALRISPACAPSESAHKGKLSMLVLLPPSLPCRRFDAPGTVLCETKHLEGSYAELHAAGAPAGGRAFEDAESAAAVFNAVAPVGTVRFELQHMQLPGSSISGGGSGAGDATGS